MTPLFLLWGLHWAPGMSGMGSCPLQRWVAACNREHGGGSGRAVGFPSRYLWTSPGAATCWLRGPGPVTQSLSLTFPSMRRTQRHPHSRGWLSSSRASRSPLPTVTCSTNRNYYTAPNRFAPSQWTVAGSSLSLSLSLFFFKSSSIGLFVRLSSPPLPHNRPLPLSPSVTDSDLPFMGVFTHLDPSCSLPSWDTKNNWGTGH